MAFLALASRFLFTIGVVFLVLTALLWNAPGRDLDDRLWGQSTASMERATATRDTYVSFTASYAGELLHGRGGESQQFNVPVNELVAERMAVSVGLAWRGLVTAWVAALLAGVVSHFWGSFGSAALGVGSLLLSLPAAFLVLSMVLAGAPPWLGLAVCVWPKFHSYWETILVLARKRTHVLSLLAQGANPWTVQWHAIWRPALRQLVGLLAVSVPLVFGALIPLEVLCDEPGLGQLAWRAVAGRDLPLLTTLTLLFTACTCAMGLVAESARPETA